jgi:uncharacterized protein with HEPN domain
LSQDRVLVLALMQCIEIVGEAASKISLETQAQFDSVPWADIIGMRNPARLLVVDRFIFGLRRLR